MAFNKISNYLLERFTEIVGPENIFTTPEQLQKYAHDETEDLVFFPQVAVSPVSAAQISDLLKLCSEHLIPVTPRGAGTGLSGGALPVLQGLVISTEKLNKIIEIDQRNLQATLESGVITEVFMNAAVEHGLFYPVDPSSKGSCFIGGNVSHGSGGPRAVKYGTIKEYVLNLEVVLPNGEIIWTGANTLKYASGYNLTQLMIGSEGTLGIITKVVLKLLPIPTQNLVMLASFPNSESACAAVSSIFRTGITPSCLEFMERRGVEWVIEYDHFQFDLKPEVDAFLMIEVDGHDSNLLLTEAEKINTVLESHGCSDVLLADTSAQKEAIWRLRRNMPLSVKSNSIYKEEDTVVPRAELPKLISGIKLIGLQFGFDSVCYGHAGDGNLHVNIIKGNMTDFDWNNKLKDGIREIFELTVSLGGTISGEHGIGLVQREFMDIKYSTVNLNLMRGIKNVFDPKGILNPGKIF
ncbi:FAD-binding oxidoreductase [Daejeonella lutea]|uniref:Glycolate oxidase n=1 Tax=Daejeonella lutea TaxID=572036 RepID=A0A1T5B6U5_9SPHI|nr:FAD-linked oxidase C-terminal domain-containing protein [Daejeonella lutea]SKB42690.1 glycolate oxidase [Daejeonella lutea]